MKKARAIFLALLAPCLLSACQREPEDDAETLGLYQSDSLWPMAGVRVCYDLPEDEYLFSYARSTIRTVVQDEYNARTAFQFTGFDFCSRTKDADVRIQFKSKDPATGGQVVPSSAIGPRTITDLYLKLAQRHNASRANAYQRQPLVLSVSREGLDYVCGKKLHAICLHNVTLHEFGHVVGLRHEQERADNADGELCDKRPQVIDAPKGMKSHGSFDHASVMNYCNPDYFARKFRLSAGDVKTINFLYGEKRAR